MAPRKLSKTRITGPCWFAPMSTALFLLLSSCDGADCAKAPATHWRGESDRGTAIGCTCRCEEFVSCFPLEGGCPIGTEVDLSTQKAEVGVDRVIYVLTAEQQAEVEAACARMPRADEPCDTGL